MVTSSTSGLHGEQIAGDQQGEQRARRFTRREHHREQRDADGPNPADRRLGKANEQRIHSQEDQVGS